MKVFRRRGIQTFLKFLTLASLILLLAACSISVTPETITVTPTNPSGPTPSTPPTSGANTLLVNPSFATTDAWIVCAGTNQGNYTIGTGDFVATGTACAFQTIPITTAATYTLVCNAQSDALTSTISLSMLDSNFNTITDVFANVTSATLETTTLSLASVANTAYVSATLYNDQGTSTIADCGLVAN